MGVVAYADADDVGIGAVFIFISFLYAAASVTQDRCWGHDRTMRWLILIPADRRIAVVGWASTWDCALPWGSRVHLPCLALLAAPAGDPQRHHYRLLR